MPKNRAETISARLHKEVVQRIPPEAFAKAVTSNAALGIFREYLCTSTWCPVWSDCGGHNYSLCYFWDVFQTEITRREGKIHG